MKKKITRIWSAGLVLMLSTSLLLWAAPVSGSELGWGTETIPSSTNQLIVNTFDIFDMAVAGDGETIYVANNTSVVSKSTDGGKTWGTKTTDGTAAALVAVAPDDPDLVVISNLTTTVEVSTDGGSTWDSLLAIDPLVGAAADTISDIAVSPDDSGKHYIAVAGTESGPIANVWYYKLGATAAAWTELNLDDGFGSGTGTAAPVDKALALGFSPNFASDKMLLTVTLDSTSSPSLVLLEVYSFNNNKWNEDAALTSYPATIKSDSTITDAEAALTVSPEYLGQDDAMRNVFVGLNVEATDDSDIDGIYRMKDTTSKALKEDADVWSIAYDGTNLIAGSNSTSAVWRSSDPMASSPTVSGTSSLKRLLGRNVIVAWNGADVLAGTRGTFSAFGISRDDGKSFNALSLVDYGVNGVRVEDVAVSADGESLYIMTTDGANAYGLWRNASDWEMVFNKIPTSFPTNPIVRVAPDDTNSVYIAEDRNDASQVVYYSSEGGDTKWFLRSTKAVVSDLAVESADVLYFSSGSDVYQSTNSGFTWGDAESAKVDTVSSLKSLGEDKVLATGTGGKVAYSTDGGATWTKPHATKTPFSSGNVFATASGLSDGDFIYAASSVVSSNLVRWEIGESTSWTDIISGELGTTVSATGIELSGDGVLYVTATNTNGSTSGFFRALSPSTADSTTTWSTANETDAATFGIGPDSLTLSAGSTKLWAVDSAFEAVYVYEDTLAAAGPDLSGPPNGTDIAVNPVSGNTFSVSFSWARPSKGTFYNLEVALDSDFDEVIYEPDSAIDSTSSTVAHVVAGTTFMPETKYYWHVRTSSTGPIYSPWSSVRSFTTGKLAVAAPVVIEQPPAPIIQVPPAPAPPAITIQPPDIILPQPEIVLPQPQITLPPPPAAPAQITPAYIWAIIIIGAILVIAVVILIVRTRRPV